MEIKIKWIPRKQMTHENTYRDDNNNNNIVLSMLYAEIYPKVRRHNARPSPSGRALCLLTLGHISAYNMRHITWTTQYYCINSKDMECTSETRFAICQLTNITHLTMFIYIYIHTHL